MTQPEPRPTADDAAEPVPPVVPVPPPTYHPSYRPPVNGRPRRWMVILTVFWALVLAAGIGWAEFHRHPTDREQTTIAQAAPVVDAAIADVALAAAADDQAVPVLAGFERVSSCHVSVIRPGEQYERVVTALVTPGTEEALLRRVADRLPASFGARVQGGPLPMLRADAGFWVRLVATTLAPGRVRFAADTGDCRVRGDLPSAGEPTADRSAVTEAFARLNLAPGDWHTYQVACPGGGTLSTVEASGPDGVVQTAAGRAGALRDLGSTVVSTADTYAYRRGDFSVGVRTENHRLIVSSTTSCR